MQEPVSGPLQEYVVFDRPSPGPDATAEDSKEMKKIPRSMKVLRLEITCQEFWGAVKRLESTNPLT